MKKSKKKSTVIVGLTRIGSIFCSLLLNLVAAIRLSDSAFGALTFFLSLISWASVLQRCGLDRYTLRKVAANETNQSLTTALTATVKSWALVQILIFLVLALAYYTASKVSTLTFIEYKLEVAIILLTSITLSMIFILADVLRGLGHISIGLGLSGVAIPLAVTMAIVTLSLDTVNTILTFYMISTVLTLVLALLVLRKITSFYVSELLISKSAKIHDMREPINIMFHTFAVMGFAAFPVIAIGLISGAAEVSSYQKPFLVSMIIGSIVLVTNAVLEPHFAKLAAASSVDIEHKDFIHAKKMVFTLSIICFTLTATVFVIFFKFDHFNINPNIILLLCLSQIINLHSSPYQCLLLMRGDASTVKMASMVAFAVLVLTLPPATISFSIYGAASSVFVSMSVKYMYYRKITK